MKNSANLKIVHESETQRQHIRLSLPAKVEIEGRNYNIQNLSPAGIAISDITGNFAKGQRIRLRLKLPFGGFSVGMNLEAVVRHYDAQQKALGCAFTGLAPDQVSLLNHVIKSFIAGDVVASNDILNVAARNNFARTRKQAEDMSFEPGLRHQLPGLLAVTAIGFLIASFIAGNLYSSLFIVKSADAMVTGPAIEVRSTAEGIYHPQLDPGSATVRQNQTIGTITPAAGTGRTATVSSPCNCYVVKTPGVESQYVSSGTPLATIVPVDTKPWVTAEVDSAQAAKMTTSTPASIRVFGTTVAYPGHIRNVESNMIPPGQTSVQSTADHMIIMQIIPDQKLPVDLMNRPAIVSFNLHDFSMPDISWPDLSWMNPSNWSLPRPDLSAIKAKFSELADKIKGGWHE